MPQIFDNIEHQLLEGLNAVLQNASACSFCIGYLNLRGWGQIAELVEALPGGDESAACRVLVGMHRPPEEEMKALARIKQRQDRFDGPTLARLKRRITESFKEQLEFGVPSNEAEFSLRRLAAQLRARKVLVRYFLRYPLHAKLYLIRRSDPVTPLIAFVGSSNLTLAGLSRQGELNVDVVEQDAAAKLQKWFEERWQDEFAFDLTDELAELIEGSWASGKLVRPYLVYLKIAYHLSEEARQGEREFKMPKLFREVLLDFQAAAVSLAAHHLHRRGGVLLGDVVGLGKTLMATAIARIMQEDQDYNTLVICPPKLQPMWDQHLQVYQITGRVLSLGRVTTDLPTLPRYRLVIIDESHNLRNREGQRYRAIRDYIEQNESRVLLVTATPYNKHYADISNQLRLFVDEDEDLHLRPEHFFQQWVAEGKTEADFIASYQMSPRSLRAFELSHFPEDWRDLMRLFLVRRTRQFIIKHYAKFDAQRQRYFVMLNGEPAYFPVRMPKVASFPIAENDPRDQYARLFSDQVVAVIEQLILPRYGLANFLRADAEKLANPEERRVLINLNRAGRRLIGFCRTNLFKRLESSGYSFLLSVDRHILRNLVALHALKNGLPLPIGTQDPAMLDTALNDADEEFAEVSSLEDNQFPPEAEPTTPAPVPSVPTLADFQARAEQVYKFYRTKLEKRFDWLDAKFFRDDLAEALRSDTESLHAVRSLAGEWDAKADAKLGALQQLLMRKHGQDKVIVFTQFADTALYLGEQLKKRGVTDIEVATNASGNPVSLARRFSPSSNRGLQLGETELRVLIATDVLAEGQNLQDAHIVVNYDLPWAIIRLIQRAGRVDRIGQKHDTITVYSFLPADGVEQIIRLRKRLFERLRENQEVIGTDESFFGENAAAKLRDLYTEKAGTLDEDEMDEDIDIASLALQVWDSASAQVQKAATALPPIISATRALPETADPAHNPPGVITYLRFPDGADALVRVDQKGNLISQSLSSIFRAAACPPDTPPLPGTDNHHELVARCLKLATEEQTTLGGHLGSLRHIRRKLYDRLKRFREQQQARPTIFTVQTLQQLETILDLIWRYPLKRAAQDAISRQMRLGITDEALLELVWRRAEDESLCEITEQDEEETAEPRVICSLGLTQSPLEEETR